MGFGQVQPRQPDKFYPQCCCEDVQRVSISKWGKVSKHEGEAEIIPMTDKHISAIEFELVEH